MHSVSDLTTFARKTKGDVPPPLVGASTTVVNGKMYLFGGRLVSLRKMVADLYVFDLETFIWEKLDPTPGEDIPGARYFHSADSWNNHLVVFGGMGYSDTTSEELCVLSDVRLFDITARKWTPPLNMHSPTSPFVPRARYAHLSSITSSRLYIIGGQDLSNVWLDDIHVFDLPTQEWVERKDYPRHCGTYRSVAVSAETRVRFPQEELKGQSYGFLGPVGSRFRPEKGGPLPASPMTATASSSLIHLPYSTAPTPEYPNDIYLYSNYNFTDVKRELEVFSPLPQGDFTITDRSTSMSGSSLPPGLRFPTGAVLGSHLLIAGTYLAHSYQSFSIWALDLVNMTWTRIDPGTTLSTGSWCRGVLWESRNKFLIFGNRDGNLVEDYNRRLLSWDHVAYIDLEAFGIYQPPPNTIDIAAQELGLAALEEGVMADFEVVCDDGRRIKCSRKALEERWPWFREQRKLYLEAAARALESLPSSAADVPLPELPEAIPGNPRPDPRLTPRSFHLSEPYPISLALLQYIYSQALITRLQHAPAVLSALLLLSSTYQLPGLERLVRHAMHRALSPQTSVGVYEVATLCDCQSLQIRALKVVMSSSKQKPAPRPRGPDTRNDGSQDGHRGGGGYAGGGGGGGYNGGGNGGYPGGGNGQTRPRGMSDARTRGPEPPRGPPGGGYYAQGSAGAVAVAGSATNLTPHASGRSLQNVDGPRPPGAPLLFPAGFGQAVVSTPLGAASSTASASATLGTTPSGGAVSTALSTPSASLVVPIQTQLQISVQTPSPTVLLAHSFANGFSGKRSSSPAPIQVSSASSSAQSPSVISPTAQTPTGRLAHSPTAFETKVKGRSPNVSPGLKNAQPHYSPHNHHPPAHPHAHNHHAHAHSRTSAQQHHRLMSVTTAGSVSDGGVMRVPRLKRPSTSDGLRNQDTPGFGMDRSVQPLNVVKVEKDGLGRTLPAPLPAGVLEKDGLGRTRPAPTSSVVEKDRLARTHQLPAPEKDGLGRTIPQQSTVAAISTVEASQAHAGSAQRVRRKGSRDELSKMSSREELRRPHTADPANAIRSRPSSSGAGAEPGSRSRSGSRGASPHRVGDVDYAPRPGHLQPPATQTPLSLSPVMEAPLPGSIPGRGGLEPTSPALSTASGASGRMRRLIRELEDASVGVRAGDVAMDADGWHAPASGQAAGAKDAIGGWTESRVSNNQPPSHLNATPPSDSSEDIYFATQPDLSPLASPTPFSLFAQLNGSASANHPYTSPTHHLDNTFASHHHPEGNANLYMGNINRGRSGTTTSETPSLASTSTISTSSSDTTRRRGFSDAMIREFPYPPPSPLNGSFSPHDLSRSNSGGSTGSGGMTHSNQHQLSPSNLPYLHRIDERQGLQTKSTPTVTEDVDSIYTEHYVDPPAVIPITPPLRISPKSSMPDIGKMPSSTKQYHQLPKNLLSPPRSDFSNLPPELAELAALDTFAIGSSMMIGPFRSSKKKPPPLSKPNMLTVGPTTTTGSFSSGELPGEKGDNKAASTSALSRFLGNSGVNEKVKKQTEKDEKKAQKEERKKVEKEKEREKPTSLAVRNLEVWSNATFLS